MNIIDEDFTEMISVLQKKKILKQRLDNTFKKNLQKNHVHIYSLMIWDVVIKKQKKPETVFLKEIRSDAIRSLPLCLLGYNKASSHAIRSIVENVLRLMYYSDHRTKIKKLNLRKKGDTSFQMLFNYTKSHKKYQLHLNKLKTIDRLSTLYSDTSRYVHAISSPYLDLSVALKSIKFDITFFNFYLKSMEKCARNINCLLCIKYYKEFRNMDKSLRSIIQKSLGKQYKKYIMNEIC